MRTDSQQKLKKLLTDEGYRTEILTDKIKTTDREDWVQKKLAAGMQVLITNPSLVETGLDLNAFTTLVFYSMGYKLFTLRQASRRSWRINQKAPAVKVYMLYYEDTMQQKCLKLMASKLAVAGLIEGNFSEEGLAAMSDVQDMTSQMAKELMLGIRDNVEDIAAAFKKMAFENRTERYRKYPLKKRLYRRNLCRQGLNSPSACLQWSRKKSCKPPWCSWNSRKPSERRKRSRWKTS